MVLLENISYVQQTPKKKKTKCLLSVLFFRFFVWNRQVLMVVVMVIFRVPSSSYASCFSFRYPFWVGCTRAPLKLSVSCSLCCWLFVFQYFFSFFFIIFLFFWWICIAFSHVFIYFNAKVHCHYILVLHAAEILLQWWQIILLHLYSCNAIFFCR